MLTGFAAGLAGPALLIAFLLNGVIAAFTAMSYAELGASFPEAGGAYSWVTEALPSPYGFYTGWANWFAQAVACVLYAVTFGTVFVALVTQYSSLSEDFVLFGFLTLIVVEKALAALVVALFAYINYRGVEETGAVGVVVTSIKIVILGVFVVFGVIATFDDPNWGATSPRILRLRPAGSPVCSARWGSSTLPSRVMISSFSPARRSEIPVVTFYGRSSTRCSSRSRSTFS